ncbi:MAG: TonB-dependent receptor [Pyrinomonadaceae bacterium]|nr:TonB-dependent receptor [Pyrinomonadaceae bacterium]
MKNLFFIVYVFLCFSQVFSQEVGQEVLRGKIVDANGSPIEKASVKIVLSSGQIRVCQTESEGNFICEKISNENFTLLVEAQDFSILRQNFADLQDFSQNNVFTLAPAALREEVIVTANRVAARIGETPASVVTLSSDDLKTTAAPTVDDALRQVAGFSLFRRTGSRSANPTAQGVSLRGLGASGASRSLVLFEGVPLNDSFGGWVQWGRVPTVAVERVEVLRGGASSLYGNNSLSGAINILPRRTTKTFNLSAEIYGGTQHTFSGSTFVGFKKNGWTTDLVAASFQTQGYVLVERRTRGLADVFAGSRNSNLSGRVGRELGDAANVFFKTAYFGEVRTNGTGLQTNRTHIRQLILGGDWAGQNLEFGIRDSGLKIQSPRIEWRIYGGTQTYDQIFSAVSANRNSETLNRVQRVPAQNVGFSANGSVILFENQTVVAGFEIREVRGASDEVGVFNNRAASLSGAGGRERTAGFFVQDFARIGKRLVLSGSARFDSWRNYDAASATRTLSNNQTSVVNFPDRNESAFSPQISLLFQATKNFSFFALGSKSFRAPTLNELYRGFRVGNIVTLANENLRAERALNYESGAGYNLKNFYLRGNFFWTRVSQPIANVTLTVAPNLITRRRQNVGATKSKGLEIEAETRIKAFVFSIGYLLADSRVEEFPANRALENLFVPQVARHQLTFQARYARRDWSYALQGRASSAQFDDDLNLFRLEPYFQLDAFIAKRFKENLQAFVGIENVFNSRYSIGRTPVRTVGSPVNLRVGVRWK